MKKIYLPIGMMLILCIMACQSENKQSITLDQSQSFPSFILTNDELSQPLKITSDTTTQEGSLFFETANGKIWIQGAASDVSESATKLEAKWMVDNRDVTITIEKDSNNFHFDLQADPDDDILGWGFHLNASQDEYFTGLFERTVDGNQRESWAEGITEAMNIRGQSIDMIIKPTLSLYNPFYISSNGYGLFIEGTWPGHYDMCHTNPNQVAVSFEGTSMSGTFYTSSQPAELVKTHALRTGPTIVPPEWAFLPWRWRDNHTHNETYYDGTPVDAPYNSMLVEDMLMMKALDIPCGLYWVDRPWSTGFRGYADFEWDPKRFPNALEMINWIHEQDSRFMVWIAPWLLGDMKEAGDQMGYSIPVKGHGNMDSTNTSLIDYTNPKAVEWWQENYLRKLLEQGVDGFKLDRSEEMVPETRDIVYHDGRTAREVRNDYPVMYVKAVHDISKEVHGDDFILIPRAGYTGSMQYSGFWGGDIGSEPESLRAAIIAAQRSSIIGFPVWGSDIGGYWQGDLDREVFARWLAFGCFNPIMEVGPTEDRAPWDMDSVPHYDAELIAVWRLYAKIHTELASYSHALVQEANKTGMPPIRPLFLHYPRQKQSWNEWQTYMYGPDILVSTIWQKGISDQQVYLPAGDKWVDAWNPSEVYEGGQEVEITTPMYKIPVFIREGSDIDLGNLEALYEESLVLAQDKPDLKELENQAFK